LLRSGMVIFMIDKEGRKAVKGTEKRLNAGPLEGPLTPPACRLHSTLKCAVVTGLASREQPALRGHG
jgi:hypothetical protein